MRGAEQALIDAGTGVDELMLRAGRGAAEWVWRVAAGHPVTVLCGPGNNGGDGYVIAQALKQCGGAVHVVAPMPPATDAARHARAAWQGGVLTSGKRAKGTVLVDCLFGSGLTRPLSAEHALLLRDLADRHHYRVALDLPSGVESDGGTMLNEGLPHYELTLALGAWKFAHWRLPARQIMGVQRLVPIGIEKVAGAAWVVDKPKISAPAVDAHKYTRGLCAVVAGAMPGAAVLASKAAMHAGAGYVKLLADEPDHRAPAGLVVEGGALSAALSDNRINAVLAGPGLGRDGSARARLRVTFEHARRVVLDADALVLLSPDDLPLGVEVLATPHDGELEQLCRNFGVVASGRQERAQALAKLSGMVVLAKGPDSVIAAPDGRLALVPPASSWLSVAGSGDVLAGIAASRMACGSDAFTAACDAVWLHGEAARLAGCAFSADDLAAAVGQAIAATL
ncbi:MAG: bifunctional ADP-dependent NAD(P)H-hydrate dehydratase/NAD(P)H-hydrate epimerase [Erythrobacter sp.]|nr:bifunctional ADP-dependent NAD(P)H-hydrate dehydratase/NAD(P)H-hydrate epimerase [Erythrobacter sp.]